MRLFAALAVYTMALGAGMAQEAGRAAQAPLRVGVVERPPFAIRTGDGAWLGIGTDFWRLVAEDLGLSYRYVEVGPEDGLAALEAGTLDVLMPVDATSEIERAFDASHPIYTATMGVAERRPPQILSVVQGFASMRFLRLLLWLSVLLLAVGALVWVLERRRNPEQFNRSMLRGLGDGFWWAGVTLTTIGYGDKAPVTLLGRAVAMLWMLVGLSVSAALTAAIVTLAGGSERADVPDVFAGDTVGVLEGSTAAGLLQRAGVPMQQYPSLARALEALDGDAVDAVAAAAPALSYAVDEAGLGVSVRRTRLDPQYVSFVLPAGSPLRDPLNVVLLRRLASESGLDLIERYLPEAGGD